MHVDRARLGHVAKIFAGVTAKAADIQASGRSGNVLTVRALTGTGIDPDELTHVELDESDQERYRVEPGDILLSARSTNLRTAVVPEDLNSVTINSTLLAIRCLPSLEPRLLVAYLNHPDGRAALQSVAQTGTRQMNITVAALESLVVPVPPPRVQQHLVRLLEAADEFYETSIAAAMDRLRLARHLVATAMKEMEATVDGE